METIFGLSVPLFTNIHVAISLIGIIAGFVLLCGMMAGRFHSAWNNLFLIFTILTSVTGFMFHSKAFGPPHIVGAISLVVLAVALFAQFGLGRQAMARTTYAITAAIAQWLNVFVLVTQAFQKVPFLHGLAPGGSEPPFLVAQVGALLLMAWIGWRAAKSGV
ncbi:hypothetical protein [Sphingomonas sp.]|uniref:hypothetical protein n=1 Tax=Sphingomonas sp. TaxID=28214 RepID=UPI0025F4B491|nr:hypothetical protein [Sphingomonas sp.]